MRCTRCGSEETGKFCSRCGSPLGSGGGACAACGRALEDGALFCSECGAPTGVRPRKPVMAYLPWLLSALALAAFSVAITLFVRTQSAERAPGMPPTGAVPGAQAGGAGGAGQPGPATGMPTAAELARMSPREAADRLFDRAMQTDEAGDAERARFFASMAIQAYAGLPDEQVDLDARFHLGLLHIVMGDAAAARAEMQHILAADPDHLLGLTLAARTAELEGDEAGRRSAYERFLEALPAGLASGRAEYQMHDRLLQTESERAREATGRE